MSDLKNISTIYYNANDKSTSSIVYVLEPIKIAYCYTGNKTA